MFCFILVPLFCTDAFVEGKIILKNNGLVMINHVEERAPKWKGRGGQVKF